MTAVQASIQALHAHMGAFSAGASAELGALRRDVEQRPVVGATAYRHALRAIGESLDSAAIEVQGLESLRSGSLQVGSGFWGTGSLAAQHGAVRGRLLCCSSTEQAMPSVRASPASQ